MPATKRVAAVRYATDHDSNAGDETNDSSSGSEWEVSAEAAGCSTAGNKRKTRRHQAPETVTAGANVHHKNIPPQLHAQDGEQDAGIMRKEFKNACVMIRRYEGSRADGTHMRHVYLQKNIQSVFCQLPVEVELEYVVDGQAQPQPGPSARQMARVMCYKQGPKEDVFLLFQHSSNAVQYAGYILTSYVAESGSTTTEPKLTLHLKSPAVQQAEEEAARAEGGWITHKCRQARAKPRSLGATSSSGKIYLPQDFANRAFHDASQQNMSLQVTITKDNMRLVDCNCNGRLSYWRIGQRVQPVVHISSAAASALAGCCLQRLRAKPPNLLEVVVASASGTQQLEQPFCSTSSTLGQLAPTAAAPPLGTAAAPSASPPPPPSSSAAPSQAQAAAASQEAPLLRVKRRVLSTECATVAAAAAAGGGGLPSAPTPPSPQPEGLVADQSLLVTSVSQPNTTKSLAVDKLLVGQAEQLLSAVAQQPGHDHQRHCEVSVENGGQSPQLELPSRSRLSQDAKPGAGSTLRSEVLLSAQPAASLHQTLLGQQIIVTQTGRTGLMSTWNPAAAAAVPGSRCGAAVADCSAPSMQAGMLTGTLRANSAKGAEVAATAAAHLPPSSAPSLGAQPMSHQQAGVSAKLPAVPAAESPVSAQKLGVQPGVNAARGEAPIIVIDSDSDNEPPVQVGQHHHHQQQPQQRVVQVKKEQQQQRQARLPHTGPLTDAATTADFAAPANGQGEQQQQQQHWQLLAGFTLIDCGDDILAAGRQLTRLLDLLQAPDTQVVQLNACINGLCQCDQSHHSRVSRFWFDYSQLQVWVNRRNVQELRSAIQQLLLNASKKWGS